MYNMQQGLCGLVNLAIERVGTNDQLEAASEILKAHFAYVAGKGTLPFLNRCCLSASSHCHCVRIRLHGILLFTESELASCEDGLVSEPLQQLGTFQRHLKYVVVVDALDECEKEADIKIVLPTLVHLASDHYRKSSALPDQLTRASNSNGLHEDVT